ncbi:hypothetical protein BCR44DRAFT_1526172 [Catenaria anguillulae PL171]|uniref:TmcB/TmcC TPR repeats domain-containing protein n=1 Tax=Catenaria anguillulae PL171 TaxID=765915 RepID=A0A1Y2HRQ6_9FUNG|nr:hypothetical protein BCR44DRAFT_1526172 [Catenaria anguillulae PL171]
MASPQSPIAPAPHPGPVGSPPTPSVGRAQSVTSGKRSDAIKAFLPSNALQKATFEIVYILSKDTDLPERLTWLFAVLEDAQMFVFAFNAGVHRQMPAYVETIVDVFGTPNDPAGFTVMNACCIAVVFLVILLTALAVGLAKVNRVPILLLRVLRLLFAVMINVLNVPLTTVLLMALHCPTEPDNSRPVWCWPGLDIATIVLNSVAIISFLPMLWVSAVMFIDANPASSSPMAKPDGQLELHGVILRLTLVALKVFITGNGHVGSEVLVYLLLATAGLLYLTHQLITTHPYFDPRMSMLRSGMHCGATFAIVTSLLLNLTVGVNSGDLWYLLIPAAVVGIVVGALLSHFSLKRLLHGTIRLSRKLKQAEAGVDSALMSAINGVGKHIQGLQEANASESGTKPHQRNTSTDTLNAFMERRPKERTHLFDSPRAVEICLRVLRDNPTPRQNMLALQLLEHGLAEFPRDPQLLLMASAYLQSYFGDDGERAAFQVMQILQSGKVTNPPLHIRFKIYCNERSTREMGKHVLDSATITILMRKVRKHHLLSMCLTRDAWEAIRTSASESTLAEVISKLAKHKSMAEECYRQLLSKSSRDKNLLRLYSQFAHFVLANTELAAEVLEHAEEGTFPGTIPFSILIELAETEQQTMITTANNAEAFMAMDQQRLKDAVSSPVPTTAATGQHRAFPAKHSGYTIPSDMDVIKAAPKLDQPSEECPPVISSQPIHVSPPAIRSMSISRPSRAPSQSDSIGSIDKSNLSMDANNSTQVKFMGRVVSKDSVGPLPSQPRSRRGSMFKDLIGGDTGSATGGGSSPNVAYPPTSIASIPHRNEVSNWVMGANIGNGSQTSGTSASRLLRKKQAARRRMAERVASPLGRLWLVAGFTVIFLGSVVYGYTLVNHLFQATRSFLVDEYNSARLARLQARAVAEDVRLMVHGNEIGSHQVWKEAYASAQEAVNDLVGVHIPALATYFQSDALTVKPKLTQSVFNSIPEFTWLTENMAQVFELLTELNYMIMEGYVTTLARDSAAIILTASASLLCLASGLGLIYVLVLKEYFMNESKVIKLLLAVPKRAASDIVTTLEAEIEGYLELFAGDSDGLDDDAEVRASTGSAGVATSGNNDRRGKVKRRQKYALMLMGFGVALAALTAGMYFFTMSRKVLANGNNCLTSVTGSETFAFTQMSYFRPLRQFQTQFFSGIFEAHFETLTLSRSPSQWIQKACLS